VVLGGARVSNKGKYRSGCELLYELRDVIAAELGSHHLAPERASAIAVAVVDRVRSHFRGSFSYLPQGKSEDARRRAEAVRAAAASGQDRDQICKQQGIRRSRYYAIIRGSKTADEDGE
jgi:hypothetical protein